MGQASHFWKVNQYFLNKNKNRSQSSTLSPLASESIQNLIDFPSTLGRKRGERKTDKLSSLKNEIWQKCQKSSYFFFQLTNAPCKNSYGRLALHSIFHAMKEKWIDSSWRERRSSSRKICFWSFFWKEHEKRVPQ